MPSKINRILQYIRDAIMIIFSIIIMSTSYGKWITEPAHYILFGIAMSFLILTIINLILLIAKHDTRKYFLGNTIYQLIAWLFLSGLLGVIGLIFVALNIAILITSREKHQKQNFSEIKKSINVKDIPKKSRKNTNKSN